MAKNGHQAKAIEKAIWVKKFLLQNIFCKLINIFVFFVFILVDAFSGCIKTEKSQKIFLP